MNNLVTERPFWIYKWRHLLHQVPWFLSCLHPFVKAYLNKSKISLTSIKSSFLVTLACHIHKYHTPFKQLVSARFSVCLNKYTELILVQICRIWSHRRCSGSDGRSIWCRTSCYRYSRGDQRTLLWDRDTQESHYLIRSRWDCVDCERMLISG